MNRQVCSIEVTPTHQTDLTSNQDVLHRDLKPHLHLLSSDDAKSLPTSKSPIIYATEYCVQSSTLPDFSPFDVVICFSESPDLFYFQLESEQSVLEIIQTKVQIAACNADELGLPFIGCPCLALYDRDWYRGEIIELYDANNVGVRYVDFGNTATVANTSGSIRKLELEFSQQPFLAVAAKLDDVMPTQKGFWSETEINKFKQMVDSRTLSLELVRYEKELACVRMRQQKTSKMDLAQYLIRHNFAASSRKELAVSKELNDEEVVPKGELTVATNASSTSRALPHYTGAIPKMLHPDQRIVTRVNNVNPPTTTVTSGRRTSKEHIDTNILSTRSTAAPLSAAQTPFLPTANTARSLPVETTSSSHLTNVAPVPVTKSQPIPTPVTKSLPIPTPVVSGTTATHQYPASQSVICKLKTKDCIRFLVDVGFDACSCTGFVIRNSRNFKGGMFAVTEVSQNLCQDEFTAKLSLVEDGNSSVRRYCFGNLLSGTSHWLEIVAEDDGFVVAKFKYKNFPEQYRMKLERATSLAEQSISKQTRHVIEGRRPEPGFTSEVILLAAERLDCLYVLFVDDISNKNDIRMEMSKISTSCASLSCPPAVGSYVIGLFPEDGRLHRARVLSTDGESIRVHYIDLGTSAIVTLKELKVLPDEMLKYPACATRVSLSRVPPSLDVLPADIKSYLEEYINVELTIVITVSSGASCIECTLANDDEVLNDYILEQIRLSQQSSIVEEVRIAQASGTEISRGNHAPEPTDGGISKEDVAAQDTFGPFLYEDGEFQDLPEDGEFDALILSSDQPQCIMMCAADETMLLKMDQLQVTKIELRLVHNAESNRSTARFLLNTRRIFVACFKCCLY